MMPSAWWLLGWRAVNALCLSLAPWWFALDGSAPRTADGVMARAVGGWLALAALLVLSVRVIERARGRSPVGWMLLAAVLASVGCAAWIPRGGWPLGVCAWGLAPWLWATAAVALWRALPKARAQSLVAVGALAAMTVALSGGAMRSRDGMWRAALRRDDRSARAYVRVAARAGLIEQKVLLERCISRAVEPLACLVARADLALSDGDLATAERFSTRALSLDERNARAATVRAMALAQRAPMPDEALEAAQRAVTLAGNDRQAHYALALVFDAKSRLPEAIAEVTRAVALGAGADARLLLASLAMRTGDAATARRVTEETLRGAPEDARALYNLGLLEQRRGRFNEAREAYLRALRVDPSGYAARYNLAVLTGEAGATDEARHHAIELLRRHPGDPAASRLLQALSSPEGLRRSGTH